MAGGPEFNLNSGEALSADWVWRAAFSRRYYKSIGADLLLGDLAAVFARHDAHGALDNLHVAAVASRALGRASRIWPCATLRLAGALRGHPLFWRIEQRARGNRDARDALAVRLGVRACSAPVGAHTVKLD